MKARAALIICALLLAGCHRNAQPDQPQDPPPKTVLAAIGSVSPVLSLAGIVAPYQNVQITSSLTEPADEVDVQNGDRVHAGQQLAVLDSADIRAELAQATSNADASKAKADQSGYQETVNLRQGDNNVTQARANVDQDAQTLREDELDLARYRRLLANQFVSPQQVDQQNTKVQNDESALGNARAALATAITNRDVNGTPAQGLQASEVASATAQARADEAVALQDEVQLSKTVIRSPVDGVVTVRTLNPGEYPGTRTLFVVQQIDPVYVDLNASTSNAFLVRPGTFADISVGGTPFHALGRALAILGQSQPGSTNFTVELRVSNRKLSLKSGMPVSAMLRLPAVRGVIVPISAFTTQSLDHVVVMHDGQAQLRAVNLLARDDRRAVVQGVFEGENVVLDGAAARALLELE